MNDDKDLKNSIDTASEEGEARGRAEGRVEGRIEGRLEGMSEAVYRMSESGMSVSQISLIIGMSECEVGEILSGWKGI